MDGYKCKTVRELLWKTLTLYEAKPVESCIDDLSESGNKYWANPSKEKNSAELNIREVTTWEKWRRSTFVWNIQRVNSKLFLLALLVFITCELKPMVLFLD